MRADLVAPINGLQDGLVDGRAELGQAVAVQVDETVHEIRPLLERTRLNGTEVKMTQIEDGQASILLTAGWTKAEGSGVDEGDPIPVESDPAW